MRRTPGYIGVVVDHNDLYNSLDDYDNIEDNCPACAKVGFGSKLSKKIIYVEQTKRGPRISKHPIVAIGLDPEKQYRQCRECGNIYDLKDLPTTTKAWDQELLERDYREGDFIPGPGVETETKYNKSKSKYKVRGHKKKTSAVSSEVNVKPKGKLKQIHIQRRKIKIVKKIPA